MSPPRIVIEPVNLEINSKVKSPSSNYLSSNILSNHAADNLRKISIITNASSIYSLDSLVQASTAIVMPDSNSSKNNPHSDHSNQQPWIKSQRAR